MHLFSLQFIIFKGFFFYSFFIFYFTAPGLILILNWQTIEIPPEINLIFFSSA